MGAAFSVGFGSEQCILPVLCYLCGKADGICKLEDNLVKLRREFNDLIAKRDGVLNKVNAEELRGRLLLPVVANWLSEVQTIETSTNQLFIDASAQETLVPDAAAQDAPAPYAPTQPSQDASAQEAVTPDAPAQEVLVPDTAAQDAPALDAPTQPSQDASASDAQQKLSTFWHWPKNIVSTYSLAEKVLNKLNEVRNLSLEGVFEVVTEEAPPRMVEEEPVLQTFGLDTKLQMTCSRLMDDDITMLGLYGMGGVGKTTLLARINNYFDEVKDKFDVVIWVTVSKDADIGKIQDGIGKRLGLYDENWCTKTKREKARDIHRVLKKKPRFVLLLDDLWEAVSLTEIGIPLQGKGYKIVITTRARDVCGRMNATEEIEVECLAEKDALDLLKHHARRDTLDGEMLEHAKIIVKKCLALPLAIEVIGKYLSCKTPADEWRVLSTLEGKEKEIFPVLRYSYDHLEKEDAKLCFLYCALFPETYNIRKDELVEYWIGESIIDEEDGRETAKIRGYEIIGTLVRAWLLLEDVESNQKVCMRGLIRDMALWIVVEDGDKFVVQTGVNLRHLPIVKNWEIVTKMSLINNDIKKITNSHRMPKPDRLVTLFLQKNKLVDIVGRFFQVLSTLVVLDLSDNLDIIKLPNEISELVSLRYLSLLRTNIEYLPAGFGKLIQLIHLDLESTSKLENISPISELQSLQVLRFYGSKASLNAEILESLEQNDLDILTITVRENDVLAAFLGSNVAGCTQGLYLEGLDKVSGVSEKSFAATFGELGNLSKLEMTECDIIESETEWEFNKKHKYSPSTSSNPITPWFKNLSAVVICSCVGLTDLTWLIYAANLESLSIENSPKMEEVISREKAADVNVVEPFQKLQVLCLEYLDELKSIYWSPLSFPKLKKFHIKHCPKLHKLPLNSTSVERIDDLFIEVEEGWKEGVTWESEAAKERFLPLTHLAYVSQLHLV